MDEPVITNKDVRTLVDWAIVWSIGVIVFLATMLMLGIGWRIFTLAGGI